MNYPDHPTAVFCGNDAIAFGALCAAATPGDQVPLDLTIVGFDDIAMASWPIIDLTTVSVDLAAMAHHATALLVSRLSDPLLEARTIVVPTSLTLRAAMPRSGRLLIRDMPESFRTSGSPPQVAAEC